MSKTLNRRDFIKATSATTVGVAAIASGVTLTSFAANDKSVTNAKRWGMLIDTNKLTETEIDGMVSACQKENGWGSEVHSTGNQKPTWIKKLKVQDKATGKITDLPLMCQHCEEPPCVDVCPTNASMKREDGIVLVDRHLCIGCRYCMMACPYDARSFVHEDLTDQKEHMPRGKGTVESCTLCVHKVDNGESPACVASVNSDAVIFGDLYDANSKINQTLKKIQSTQIRADLNLNTGVRYSGI
ncbi:sulfate reduction electron transfer complex DsrMKJOP subunit DsrO [Candidatus Thioglobus sp.]|jgi:molybdopterin-containing oxidoreductase family iron-sulfur binding subunit|uniref:sulfate reduction electron transfer complex DsrMKJOP subunit DsrO n=1 Tax=Candidatus Thioglobus sp. TaxID=2026721 RepID=UPI001EBC9D37|nr:4Fe-4S dicluster domain-containing protein [Candidatus Thioglobus sp.]MBT3187229.1 4Fe-4S dicluster domain-containing protein [Candidatus Thioglobus sp.]MBT4553689.1 4Fe-4S dicluster domain-containing protein [Candidatus Thioglobus sp.]MBT4922949.1 4Fe-4S dicluster domain-containing protein [Candidatus Thioglobus sp.]MBT6327284.1 4Fe-4S dicluster domain-containing protein [Candidatus Thioglobus sp.]MBT7498185.1 4Fe-4S dicluster domain-containing protein [Candidatus Thioglobus sp.]